MYGVNRCAFLNNKHEFTVVENEIPRPGDDEVVVKIISNGICGSDLHFYQDGKLGNFVVTKPYIPGHEASGVVVNAGKDVTGFAKDEHVVIEPGIPCGRCRYCKIGRYNLCKEVVFLSAPPINGTFCDYIAIRYDCIHKVPENLSFEQAALTEPAAVAIHAVNRARAGIGDTAAIIGAGPIGLLTLQAFKAAGGKKTICVDVVDHRLKLAKDLGADEVFNAAVCGEDLVDIAEVVFETAGSAKATEALFRYARTGGRVVQVGWPAGNNVMMNIADFLDKELDYIGINRYANAFPTALTWISDGRINADRLISGRYSLDQIDVAFEFTLNNPDNVVKTIINN